MARSDHHDCHAVRVYGTSTIHCCTICGEDCCEVLLGEPGCSTKCGKCDHRFHIRCGRQCFTSCAGAYESDRLLSKWDMLLCAQCSRQCRICTEASGSDMFIWKERANHCEGCRQTSAKAHGFFSCNLCQRQFCSLCANTEVHPYFCWVAVAYALLPSSLAPDICSLIFEYCLDEPWWPLLRSFCAQRSSALQ